MTPTLALLSDFNIAFRPFKRSITSTVRPAIICLTYSVSNKECQIFTNELVATPPNAFCFSTIATRAPKREALTAANTPVQLPPKTQISTSLITGILPASFLPTFSLEGEEQNDSVPIPRPPYKALLINRLLDCFFITLLLLNLTSLLLLKRY